MAIAIFIGLFIVVLPFYIIYNIIIRWGTDIHWWEGYFVCPSCNLKARIDSYHDQEVLEQFYVHETKSGRADRRYSDNPLMVTTKYYFKCKSCETIFDITATDPSTEAADEEEED